MKIKLIKSLYVGDITQLGYDPTTSFIITYIAKLVHARYNLAGENLKLNVRWDYRFENVIIIGKDSTIIYKPLQNMITYLMNILPFTLSCPH